MWGGCSTPHPGHLTPGKETPYPFYRRLVWPQSRSGRVQKICPPPEFDPRTVQFVAFDTLEITLEILPTSAVISSSYYWILVLSTRKMLGFINEGIASFIKERLLGFIDSGLTTFYQRGTCQVLSTTDLLGFINNGLYRFHQRGTC